MNNENQGEILERTEERCLHLRAPIKGTVVFQGSSGFGWQESLATVPMGKFYDVLIAAKISEMQTRQDVPRTNSRPGKLKGLLLSFATIKG